MNYDTPAPYGSCSDCGDLLSTNEEMSTGICENCYEDNGDDL